MGYVGLVRHIFDVFAPGAAAPTIAMRHQARLSLSPVFPRRNFSQATFVMIYHGAQLKLKTG